MVSSAKIKSVDFYRKIPRDLTEASLSGAGLSIIAAVSMMFLFGMELHNYLSTSTSTSVIVDRSSDEDYLRIDFNISFPALSCEFASVDVSDVLGTGDIRSFETEKILVSLELEVVCGTQNLEEIFCLTTLFGNMVFVYPCIWNRLNITKTVRKYSIDKHLKTTGSEFDSGPVTHLVKHDDEVDEEHGEGSVTLNSHNFDRISHQHSILVVNFYAPWCYWSNRLKPSWEKAAKIIRERHDPEVDGRIIMGKVDCTEEVDLCSSHHIQGYPSIRIFRKGSDVRDEHGHHEHESYYGDRDTDTLVNTMEELVAPIALESQNLALEDKSDKTTENAKRPAPREAGCRIEGFVRVKKVPGNLVISARSGAHSFDSSLMNMSHVISDFSFGKKITPRVMSDIKRILPYIGASHDKLNGKAYLTDPHDRANVTVEHYIQVVKTEVMRSSHQLVEDYEFTAHSSLTHALSIPVVKFHYEPSPMQVLITENPKSFSHFITNVCAIIGGVFTVAGILDSILHNTLRLVKKVELGKNF